MRLAKPHGRQRADPHPLELAWSAVVVGFLIYGAAQNYGWRNTLIGAVCLPVLLVVLSARFWMIVGGAVVGLLALAGLSALGPGGVVLMLVLIVALQSQRRPQG